MMKIENQENQIHSERLQKIQNLASTSVNKIIEDNSYLENNGDDWESDSDAEDNSLHDKYIDSSF